MHSMCLVSWEGGTRVAALVNGGTRLCNFLHPTHAESLSDKNLCFEWVPTGYAAWRKLEEPLHEADW